MIKKEKKILIEKVKKFKIKFENINNPKQCIGCGIKFNEFPHIPNTDKYHRFTPLCIGCYDNKEINEITKFEN